MEVIAANKPLGAVAVLILVFGLTILALRWPQGIHATFSRHAAAQKKTIIYYIVLFLLALPTLLVFFITWLVPALHLSKWFIVLAVTSMVLQHAVTLIPEIGGWRSKWHGILTACSALLLIPMLFLIIIAPIGTTGSKLISVACLVVMASIVTYQLLIADKQKLRYLLFLQAGYYGAFFTAMLTVTYLQ